MAARAVGIVMDVNTGAVLAMSTTPAYDPNQPRVIYDAAARQGRGCPLRQRARCRPAAGPADPVAQQSRQRPVRAGQRVQAHHLRRRAGCRGCEQKLHLLLRRVHLGGGHPVPLRQPQAPRQPDRDPGAGKFLQPALSRSARGLGKEAFCDYFAAFGLREPTGVDLPAEPKRVCTTPPTAWGRWSWRPAPSARAARSPIWKWPQPCALW